MQARLDVDVPVTLCPEIGRGSYGSSGIEGHRNGKDWAPQFNYQSYTHNSSEAEIICSMRCLSSNSVSRYSWMM
ncbi:alpha-galactosidase [Vibrio ishigakensis]|uniref:Alpha-galactosidase n=1 Tax=Vibrio ishigakensis TaxID=1481914 RepID=A0A0B8PJY3_9VIBR|nr:alpha-galactosidase [Vibrio ishigakensis]